MPNEAEIRFAGAPDSGGHPQSSPGLRSPLQARAAFLKNWDWLAVVSINQGACERGRAQHGFNSKTAEACAAQWQELRLKTLNLAETFDRLRAYHRSAPFLFFNGNTFATIGRELSLALFSDLPPVRKREIGSAVAHYIAGVLDREAMVAIVESLCQSATFQPGHRVKTLRGSAAGVIVRLHDDGRVTWRADGSATELIALPESLLPEKPTPDATGTT